MERNEDVVLSDQEAATTRKGESLEKNIHDTGECIYDHLVEV